MYPMRSPLLPSKSAGAAPGRSCLYPMERTSPEIVFSMGQCVHPCTPPRPKGAPNTISLVHVHFRAASSNPHGQCTDIIRHGDVDHVLSAHVHERGYNEIPEVLVGGNSCESELHLSGSRVGTAVPMSSKGRSNGSFSTKCGPRCGTIRCRDGSSHLESVTAIDMARLLGRTDQPHHMAPVT